MTRDEVLFEREQTRAESSRLLNEGMTVTVNGNPGSVTGFQNDFATVSDRTTGLSCEYSWPAVLKNLQDNKGAFWTIEEPKTKGKKKT